MDEALIKRITDLVIEKLNSEIDTTPAGAERSCPVGVSGRHIHLSGAHVDILFGKGYELKIKKMLMGGQYACEECVTIVGTKLRAIENVRILGPERAFSQVEISKTDAIKLGINPPVRDSGEIAGSEAISVVGPAGVVYLEQGCIIAKRHIHMPPELAEQWGLRDKAKVSVTLGNDRKGILPDVLVRVDPTFTLEMHIDTDEANGLGIKNGDRAVIEAVR